MPKSDAARGPLGAWIVQQRNRRGWKVPDVLAALEKEGHAIGEASYRGYEASGPSRPILHALERIYGETAPAPETEKERTGDMPALIHALHDHTDAIRALVGSISPLIAPRGMAGLLAVIDAMDPAELNVADLIRHLESIERSRGEGSGDPKRPPDQGGAAPPRRATE